MEGAEHCVAHGIKRRHAFLVVHGLPGPARRAVEPARDFFLKPANKITRGPQGVILIAPRICEAAAESFNPVMVLGPDAVAVGKSKPRFPRPQEAVHRVP